MCSVGYKSFFSELTFMPRKISRKMKRTQPNKYKGVQKEKSLSLDEVNYRINTFLNELRRERDAVKREKIARKLFNTTLCYGSHKQAKGIANALKNINPEYAALFSSVLEARAKIIQIKNVTNSKKAWALVSEIEAEFNSETNPSRKRILGNLLERAKKTAEKRKGS